jgi:hypothetical protein
MHVPWDATSVRPETTLFRPARMAAAPAGLRPCTNADLRIESARPVLTWRLLDGENAVVTTQTGLRITR